MDKRTSQMHSALVRFLPRIGKPEAVEKIRVEVEGDGEYLIEFDGLCIHCGYPVEAPRIGKPNHTAPGYRVFWWKQHPDTRWEPGDTEDITECETLNPQAALTAIGTLYARDAAQGVIESYMPEY